MRISRKLAALAAFFVVAIAVSACGGSGSSSVPSNSVADVAGNPITLKAFNHWMYIAAKDQAASAAQQGQAEPVIVANDPPHFESCIKQIKEQIPTLANTSDATLKNDCNQVFQQYTQEVLTFLIEGYWYQAEGHRLGVSYSPVQLNKDFQKALDAQFKSKTAFQAYLKESGETEQDVRFQIRVNKIYQKLIAHYKTPITPVMIRAYYNQHKTTFGTPESRDLHLVRTTSQAKAAAALAALKSGQSWDTVAKTYAEDASAKANGGQLTGITPNEEEHAVNQAIFGSSVNKVVGPVKGIFGYYILEVTKVTPATQQSLAKATPTIKSLITQQRTTAAETEISKHAKAHWFKKTKCRAPYMVSSCSNYVAPKTTTTPTTTPSTVTTPTTPTTSATTTTATGTGTTGTGTTTTK